MAKKQLVATDMNSNKITNLANGSSAQDAAAFGQVPTAGTTPSTQAFGDTATGGSASTWSKNDHKHAMPAAPTIPVGGTPALTLTTANAAGSAATFVKTDASILAFDATALTAEAIASTSSVGTATTAARRDHVHPMPTSLATITAIGGGYAACATAIGTAAKTVALTGYFLVVGGTVGVTFTNGNSAATPTLNINSAGAKPIFANGVAASTIPAGFECIMIYDGTNYAIIDGGLGIATPATQAFGDSAVAGVALESAHVDHKHAMMAAPTTVSGNAGTATKLATPQAINGVNFDGSAPITIADSTKVPTSRTINSQALTGNIVLTPDNLDDTSSTHKFTNAAGITKIANTSNTNTGDETLATIKTKLGITTLSGSNTGDQIGDGSTISGAGTVASPFVSLVSGTQYPWRGTWASGSYTVNDCVYYNGSGYVCIAAATTENPTDTGHWSMLVQKGETGATGADGVDGAAGTATPIYNEVPGGTINGTNDDFTLAASPVTNSVNLYKNGIRLKGGGADYTLSGLNIAMVTPPATGTVLLADYLVNVVDFAIGLNNFILSEIPAGLVNSSNATYTTAATYIAGTLQVYINGLLQARATHYAETTPASGIFTMGDAPTTGDNIIVSYQHNLSSTGDADTLDGMHANSTATANQLMPLDANAKVPTTTLTSLPVAVNRQNDTTNSSVSDQLIQTGWGQISCTSGDLIKADTAITFAQTFDDVPIFIVSMLGYKATAATGPGQFAIDNGSFCTGRASSTSSAQVSIIGRDTGQNLGTVYYGYAWIAIGTKAR